MLYPEEYHLKVVDVDLAKLQQKGISLLLLDLDNTLVEWHKREAEQEILDWLHKAEALGFQLCIVSNNKPCRVHDAAEKLGLPYICRATKPFSRGFLQALQQFQRQPQETGIIGDQIFTDVWGGNRMGLYTILVQPLTKQDFWVTRVLVRKLEKIVLYGLRRKDKGGKF